MRTTAKISCRIIAGLLVKSGVRDIVLSPGSRNTPLILAFEAEPQLRKHIITDERSAAFYALGIAQSTQSPVALACTSGSAPLNYAPALAEAFYRGIPLIAISADRPQQWIDQDDSQTIRQFRSLDNIVKKSYDIPDLPVETPEYEWFVNRTVNDAIIEARKPLSGPVHINVQLNAPLGRLEDIKEEGCRKILYTGSVQKIPDEEIKELACIIKNKRILLVAGFMQPDAKLQKSVLKFCSLPNVTVMAETVSNLHLAPQSYSIDRVLSTLDDNDKERLRPEVVITLGGALISRQIKEYLRSYPPQEHWSIGHRHTTVDCFKSLTRRIDTDPEYIIRKLYNILSRTATDISYKSEWDLQRSKADASASEFIESIEWSELKAFDILFRTLPLDINLNIANGTPIRYNQLLAETSYHTTFCNRGVSGIDGCTSTAIGNASVASGPTLLITGDMAFSYDLSGLAIRHIPRNFKIILIDNAGGGIFRFIPSTRNLECREDYFCAPHPIDYKALCQAFGIGYCTAEDEASLLSSLMNFLSSNSRPQLLHIKVDGSKGGEILSRFMNRNN